MPPLESLLGWTRNELAGRQLPFDPHGPMQSKNGSFVEAAVWISPIRSPNGQPGGTVIIAAGHAALQEAGVELVPRAKRYSSIAK